MPTSGLAHPGSTTVASSPTGTTSLTSKALVALRRAFFTAESIADPQRLYKVLYDLQQNAALAIQPLAENPTLFGNILGPFVCGSVTTLNISHRLGRAYQGWYCVRAQTNPFRGYEIANPTGVTSSQMITIFVVDAGTYSFLVW